MAQLRHMALRNVVERHRQLFARSNRARQDVAMELLDGVNQEDVEGWVSRNVAHPTGQKVNFHYHEVEEWVEVLNGSMVFYSAGELCPGGKQSLRGEQKFHVDKGKVLRIPQGEVHRVEIGQGGVLYRMLLPADVGPAAFSRRLDREDIEIIKANLHLPLLETERDAGKRNATAGQSGTAIAEKLLQGFVSGDLSFRNAGGKILGKHRYLTRGAPNPPVERQPGGGGMMCILHKCPECLLLSTIVDVQGQDASRSTESFLNLRLFGKEQGEWRCRTWMNFKV
jgi:hypothetical protein